MLERAKSLKGYTLQSLDGEIGKVKEFYFSDCDWRIRWLIAETGSWLSNRQVLIPQTALKYVNTVQRVITVNMTRKQIEDSPLLDADKPISKRIEDLLNANNEWPIYSNDITAIYPYFDINGPKLIEEEAKIEKTGDPHLRSTKDMSGYGVHAIDGDAGHIWDFIIDDDTWLIRYLVVATRNWLPGKKVFISTKWIDQIEWKELTVYIDLLRGGIRESPEYKEDSAITRDFETDLHRHYRCMPYWDDAAGKDPAKVCR